QTQLRTEQSITRCTVSKRSRKRNNGICQDHEIRPAAASLDRIGRLLIPFVKVRACGRSEMASGGEAPNADAVRCQAIFLRLRANPAQSPLRILQRNRI